MHRHIFQDMMQCSDAEGIVEGDRDGVRFTVNDCPDPDMAPGLVDTLISDKREASDQFLTTNTAGEFHTVISSSRTR